MFANILGTSRREVRRVVILAMPILTAALLISLIIVACIPERDEAQTQSLQNDNRLELLNNLIEQKQQQRQQQQQQQRRLPDSSGPRVDQAAEVGRDQEHRLLARSEFIYAQLSPGTDSANDQDPKVPSDGFGFGDDSSDDDLVVQAGQRGPSSGSSNRELRNEIYLLEDKDYPTSLFEDYQGSVGQVSGISTLPNDDVVIFHRSDRHWTEHTFVRGSTQSDALPKIPADSQDNLIKNDTIKVLDRENGNSVASFGSNLFYMPHGIASDNQGNIWVSDVARHQVMRLPAASLPARASRTNSSSLSSKIERQIWPDVILGEAFAPGNDLAHFCQPSEIAVSPDGQLVFVADGYCNGRVMVFTETGKLLATFGEQQNLSVVHSLALIEERNLICVADRENCRILCYHAGLNGDLLRLGELILSVDYPLGRVFAIASLSDDHLLVSSNQKGSNRYELAILNPFTNELMLVWMSGDLLEPHSLTTTRNRDIAYVADLSNASYKKVFKFNVIVRRG